MSLVRSFMFSRSAVFIKGIDSFFGLIDVEPGSTSPHHCRHGTIARIISATLHKESIAIHGDCDCDGLASCATLKATIELDWQSRHGSFD